MKNILFLLYKFSVTELLHPPDWTKAGQYCVLELLLLEREGTVVNMRTEDALDLTLVASQNPGLRRNLSTKGLSCLCPRVSGVGPLSLVGRPTRSGTSFCCVFLTLKRAPSSTDSTVPAADALSKLGPSTYLKKADLFCVVLGSYPLSPEDPKGLRATT